MPKLTWNWKRWPLAAAALLLAGPLASAHEKWYVDADAMAHGAPVYLRVAPAFAAVAVLVVAALFLLAVTIDRRLDGSRLMRWFDNALLRAHFSPHGVLGALIGASLMGAGLQHTLFAPNLVLPATLWGSAIAIFEIGLGTLFLFLEPFYPEFGILLIVLFLAGLTAVPFWDLMEELLILGAGVYFITNEQRREPWRRRNTPERRRLGYQIFRVLVGVNFLVLAAVKWLRPELALAIVDGYHLNFLSALHVSGIQFVFFAALVETVVALCVLLRVAMRPAAVVAFLFFTLSIYFLGFRELLGHLPIKATLFLFFVYGHWHKGEQKP